jgi:hypothetical protein
MVGHHAITDHSYHPAIIPHRNRFYGERRIACHSPSRRTRPAKVSTLRVMRRAVQEEWELKQRSDTSSIIRIVSLSWLIMTMLFGFHRCFLQNARPECDFKYRSNSSARSRSVKAIYVFSVHGLNLFVWILVPALCSINLRCTSEVTPTYRCS